MSHLLCPAPHAELVTASPVLYSALKVMDEWESIFTRRLDALGAVPDDLFDNEEEESPMFGVGPALMKHKFILEPENSPFRYVTMCVCIHVATWGKSYGGGGMRVGGGGGYMCV